MINIFIFAWLIFLTIRLDIISKTKEEREKIKLKKKRPEAVLLEIKEDEERVKEKIKKNEALNIDTPIEDLIIK